MPPSAGDDKVKKYRKPEEKEFVLRSPNWNDVPASGLKQVSGNVTYINVTPEDLEKYLAQTYLAGYLSHVHGMPINITQANRKLAWENGIDLREVRGTVFERGGPAVITLEDLQRSNKKIFGSQPTTQTEEEKKIEQAHRVSRELYSVYQKYKPKTELKRQGKKMKAFTKTRMTMEQYEDALRGKGVEGLPMSSEQIEMTVRKIQIELKKLISMHATLTTESARETVDKYIDQITKFLENIKKESGKIRDFEIRSPARLKRKGPEKKKGARQFLRTSKLKKKGDSPSKSSSSSSKSTPKTPSPISRRTHQSRRSPRVRLHPRAPHLLAPPPPRVRLRKPAVASKISRRNWRRSLRKSRRTHP